MKLKNTNVWGIFFLIFSVCIINLIFFKKRGGDHAVAAIFFPHLMPIASAPATKVAFLKVVWLGQCLEPLSCALCVLSPKLMTGGGTVSQGCDSAFPTEKEVTCPDQRLSHSRTTHGEGH